MKNLKIYLILMMIFFSVSVAHGALKVSPTVVELDANKSRGNYITTAFTVQGGKDETIRFKIYPEFFDISEQGSMEPLPKSASPNSLIPYARFVPNEFTLTNGQAQKVRITISNVDKLKDGESRMVLFLEDVAAKEVILPYSNKNISTKLIVKTRIGVPVYVDKGRFIKNCNFDELKVENDKDDIFFKMKLSSTGNSKTRIRGKAQIIQDRKLISEFEVNNNVVKAGGVFYDTQKIPLKDIEKKGDYTLRVVLNYQDEKNKPKTLVKEVGFKVQKINTPMM